MISLSKIVDIRTHIIFSVHVRMCSFPDLFNQCHDTFLDCSYAGLKLLFKCVSTRYHLRSAEQALLHVPFARPSIMQSRAFSVVGPLVWKGLPLALRSLPRVFSQKFLQQLKTTL